MLWNIYLVPDGNGKVLQSGGRSQFTLILEYPVTPIFQVEIKIKIDTPYPG